MEIKKKQKTNSVTFFPSLIESHDASQFTLIFNGITASFPLRMSDVYAEWISAQHNVREEFNGHFCDSCGPMSTLNNEKNLVHNNIPFWIKWAK